MYVTYFLFCIRDIIFFIIIIIIIIIASLAMALYGAAQPELKSALRKSKKVNKMKL